MPIPAFLAALSMMMGSGGAAAGAAGAAGAGAGAAGGGMMGAVKGIAGKVMAAKAGAGGAATAGATSAGAPAAGAAAPAAAMQTAGGPYGARAMQAGMKVPARQSAFKTAAQRMQSQAWDSGKPWQQNVGRIAQRFTDEGSEPPAAPNDPIADMERFRAPTYMSMR